MCLIYKELLKIEGKNKEATEKNRQKILTVQKNRYKNALNTDLNIT